MIESVYPKSSHYKVGYFAIFCLAFEKVEGGRTKVTFVQILKQPGKNFTSMTHCLYLSSIVLKI